MIFHDTGLPGAWLLEPERIEDERGFFARTFCRQEFAAHGLYLDYPQSNISYNRDRHTLRGMHYQAAPHEEVKLVRCTRGAVWDAIVDLRPESSTFRHYYAAELSAENRHTLYVPAGFAHGFLTLVDGAELLYQMGALYRAEAARGVRWDDPAFGIAWPATPAVISERDRTYPDFVEPPARSVEQVPAEEGPPDG